MCDLKETCSKVLINQFKLAKRSVNERLRAGDGELQRLKIEWIDLLKKSQAELYNNNGGEWR